MEQFVSSVSPKGQVTVPQKIRRLLGLRARDRVEFRVVAGQVVLTRAGSRLADHFQVIPALATGMDQEVAVREAIEDHATEIAEEGL